MAGGLFEKYLDDALQDGVPAVTGTDEGIRVLRLEDFSAHFVLLIFGCIVALLVSVIGACGGQIRRKRLSLPQSLRSDSGTAVEIDIDAGAKVSFP